MDYIYGKLNEKVKKVTYDGVVTSTAKTTTTTSLDENTIKVDVLKTPGILTIVDKDGNNLSFNGSDNVQINLQKLATKEYVDDAVANAGGAPTGGAPIVTIYDTLNGETNITTLNIILTAEQATEIRKDLEHTILKLYNASSSGLREVYFYYVETKYGTNYYYTVSQGKTYVLTTAMSTGSPSTVTIYELSSGVTEEQVNDLIATYMSNNYENGNTGSY